MKRQTKINWLETMLVFIETLIMCALSVFALSMNFKMCLKAIDMQYNDCGFDLWGFVIWESILAILFISILLLQHRYFGKRRNS